MVIIIITTCTCRSSVHTAAKEDTCEVGASWLMRCRSVSETVNWLIVALTIDTLLDDATVLTAALSRYWQTGMSILKGVWSSGRSTDPLPVLQSVYQLLNFPLFQTMALTLPSSVWFETGSANLMPCGRIAKAGVALLCEIVRNRVG